MTDMSKGTVARAWKERSNELLTAFRARDLSGIDVLAVYLDGVFPGKERCVVVAMAIDVNVALNTCWISRKAAVRARRW